MADPSASRRLAIWFVVVPWLLEWVFGWSQYLGKLGGVLDVVWLLVLGYFVASTRTERLPRVLHAWLWMMALLAVTILRAWWIGWTVDSLGAFARLVEQFPEVPLTGHEVSMLDAIVDSSIIGLGLGLVGAFDAAIIAIGIAIGERLHAKRVPSRVSLLPRLVVIALQAPIFLALIGGGLAAIAGAAAHGVRDCAERSSIVLVVIACGLAAWAFAVLHLGRLLALARGALANRLLLGAVAIAAGITVALLGRDSGGTILGCVVWTIAQVAAIRWARPAPAA